MSEQDPLGVTISAREIYDQIVGLRDDVRSLVQSNAEVSKQLEDHEGRLRSVERWKYAVPTATVGAIVSAGITIAKAIGG
ncbi:hypothetical protein ACWEQ3_01465 [Streptomyces mirabilis]